VNLFRTGAILCALVDRGLGSGELESQGSQRVQFGEPIVFTFAQRYLTPTHSSQISDFGQPLAGMGLSESEQAGAAKPLV
jgi:hypothetical protein